MFLLFQFVSRLSWGLAIGMAATSPRDVTSGYFRNHLYVLLGLQTLALLIAIDTPGFSPWPPLAAAVLSYVGSVLWLYEQRRGGQVVLVLVALVSIVGAWQTLPIESTRPIAAQILCWLDPVSGGLVLGITMAAMLLGHWYLNTPTMKLAPLRRLIVLMAAAIVLRMVLCGLGLTLELATVGGMPTHVALFVSLRWIAGLFGALGVAWMTWQTLAIPNTQSATGILFVGVIVTFLGELTAQLLSTTSVFPL